MSIFCRECVFEKVRWRLQSPPIDSRAVRTVRVVGQTSCEVMHGGERVSVSVGVRFELWGGECLREREV